MKTKLIFQQNRLFFAIIIAAFIVGSFIYFSTKSPENITSRVTGSETAGSFIGSKLVTKIIDGDTVIVEGESVRLLGIDADEKGYPCYEAARKRLEELILNKEVSLDKDITDKDQYGRYLRYIFLDNQNIDLRMVKEGLAIARFSPENIKYKEEIIAAEKEARENKIGCKWGDIKPSEPSTYPSQWSRLTSDVTGLDVIGACNAGNYIYK